MTDETRPTRVDELIERAVAALNRGDVDEAHALAGEVLSTETDNVDATDLLAAEVSEAGEVRRLTVLFSDLVGSTELSSRLEPEAYRRVVHRYQGVCRSIVEERYGGAIMSFRGDGILVSFGFPVAHENDVDRAVLAGLDLVDAIEDGFEDLGVRVAVHKGLVFLERDTQELYGFAVNVAARLEALAEPGTVLVSDEVRRLLRGRYELIEHEPRPMKGVSSPMTTHTVLAERSEQPAGGLVPLLDREEEAARMEAAWEAAREGQRQPGDCVAVIGESGIGKSRLVAHLCAQAREAGSAVVTLPGSILHTQIGLSPFRRLIEDACGIDRRTPPTARLERLGELLARQGVEPVALPLLAALLGIDPSSGYEAVELDARLLREQIADATLQLLGSFLREPGAIVVAEDLHWFDDESRDLLGSLVRSSRPNVLVILASRNLADAPRGDRTVLLELDPLERSHRLELLDHVTGGALDAAALEDLAQRSDGVPLFLEELGRAALHGPTGASVGARAVSSDVPELLYEPLVARLQVDANGMGLAAAAATIGREADHDLLLRVSDLDAQALDDALAVLVEGRVLETVDAAPRRYRFRHDLLRAVAYDLQPPSRQRDLHGRVADALLEGAEDDTVDWTVVAGHYDVAEQGSKAILAYERAAATARRRGALAEARNLLHRAIELAPGAIEAKREIDLRLSRGFLAVSMEGNTSADAALDYEQCLELALESGNNEALFATLNALWSYYAARGELDRSAELLARLSEVGGDGQEAARFLASAGLGMIHGYRGDALEGTRLCEDAVARMSSFDQGEFYSRWWFVPLDPAASAHAYLAIGRLLQGELQGALVQLQAARDTVAALPFPQGSFSRAGIATLEVWLFAEVQDFEGASATLDEIELLSTQHGFDQWSIVATTQRAVVAGLQELERGADADKAALATHAAALGGYLMMWKMVDQWIFVTYYTTIQASFHAAAGELDAARATLDEALQIAERTGMHFYTAETRRYLARLAEDPDERIAGLRGALTLAREQHVTLFELRAARDLLDCARQRDELVKAVAKFAPDVSYPELDAARELLARG